MSSRMSMNVVTWRGEEVSAAAHAAAVAGLLQGAEHVRGVAVNRTPVDTADLRNSATATVDDSSLEAGVAYDTPYALDVHESVGAYHQVGQSKYLESAMNDAGQTAKALVAAKVRRAHRS